MSKNYASSRISGQLEPINKCVASVKNVEEIFSRLKINKEIYHVKKGWFQQTLPLIKKEIGTIAILRIDADWYESTKVCLDNLYDKVIGGGYIIIDDYGYWEGCKKAVDDFIRERNLKTNIVMIDHTGCFFQKPE